MAYKKYRRKVVVFKNERQMKLVLNEIFEKEPYLDNKRYKWLGRLELDRYYPRLKLAFEYNGQQHYEPCLFFSKSERDAIERYNKQLERDDRKVKLCRKYGIKLVIIPYWIKLTKRNILRYIGRVNVNH